MNYDWIVESDKREWHESYFAKRALDDHQAKGIPNLYLQIFKHLIANYKLDKECMVLDPFAGIGTTLIMANIHNIDAVGIELEEKYYKDMIGFDEEQEVGGEDMLFSKKQTIHIEGNLEKFVKVTGRASSIFTIDNIYYCYYDDNRKAIIQLINYNSARGDMPDIFHKYIKYIPNLFVVTSPPYMRTSEHSQAQIDALPPEKRGGHKAFGYENKANIALMDDYNYDLCIGSVYKNLYSVGANIAVVVTRDFIRNGSIISLWGKNKTRMEFAGFEMVEHIFAKIPDMSLFKRINYESSHKSKGLPLIDWEDVCIYKRKEVENG